MKRGLLFAAFLSGSAFGGTSVSGGPPSRQNTNKIQLEDFHRLIEGIELPYDVDGEEFRIISADPFKKRILMQGVTGSQLEFLVPPAESVDVNAE